MKLASSWKLSVALAVIAVLAGIIALPGGPRGAEADVDSVSPDSLVAEDGTTIDIDISGNEAATSALTVAVTGTSTLNNGTCTDDDGVDCGTESGPGNPISWDTVVGPYTATATLTLDCAAPEEITVTATHNADSTPVATVYCVPDLGDEQVVVGKESDDDNDDYNFDWDASGGDCLVFADDGSTAFGDDGSFDLEDDQEAEFFCESSVNLTVSEDDDGDFVEVDGCENDDGVDVDGSSVNFDISDLDDTAFCTWINDEDFVASPTVVSGSATSLSIVLSATQIQCGSAMLIQVLPRSSSGGPAAAGTTISLTSSLGGNFDPASSVTAAFPVSLANFLFTAPNNTSGVTTLTARAGNVTASANVSIVCGVSTVAPPTSTSAPLQPPSAGSGGLVGPSGGSYVPAALAVAAAAALLGLTAISRRMSVVVDGNAPAPAQVSAGASQRSGGLALLVSLAFVVVALLSRRR